MTNRVVLGQMPEGGYGLRVSKPGVDAMSTSPNPDNLLFDSSWKDVLKIHTWNEVVMNATVTTGNPGVQNYIYTTITYPALPYAPMIFLMHKADGGSWETGSFYRYNGPLIPGQPVGPSNPLIVTSIPVVIADGVNTSYANIGRWRHSIVGSSITIRYFVIMAN